MKKLTGVLFVLASFLILLQSGLQASATPDLPYCSDACGSEPSAQVTVHYCYPSWPYWYDFGTVGDGQCKLANQSVVTCADWWCN
jgi:hypothetical protein